MARTPRISSGSIPPETRLALSDLGNDAAYRLIMACSTRPPARQTGWTVSELAAECELPVSSASRLLKQLREHGWVERIKPDLLHRLNLDQPHSPPDLAGIWAVLTRIPVDHRSRGNRRAHLKSQLSAEQATNYGLRAVIAGLENQLCDALHLAETMAAQTVGTEEAALGQNPTAPTSRLPQSEARSEALDTNSPPEETPETGEPRSSLGQFADLLDPLRDQITQQRAKIEELETERTRAFTSIEALIQQHRFSSSLPLPDQRGRWGEMQLRNIIELAGMTEHCDFAEHATVDTEEDSRLRPDMIVNLPGDGTIVVDSKVALDAYLDAIESDDETHRRQLMVHHAAAVEQHVKQLADKRYWNQFERTPKVVVMFVPIESALATAMEHTPALHRDAMESHVLLVSPTLLVGLLRTIGFGWQQEDVAANAREIAKTGASIYDRLASFTNQLSKVGDALREGADAYNRTINALESGMLPAARRMRSLGTTGSDHLEEPARVPHAVRAVTREWFLRDDRPEPALGAGEQHVHVGDGLPKQKDGKRRRPTRTDYRLHLWDKVRTFTQHMKRGLAPSEIDIDDFQQEVFMRVIPAFDDFDFDGEVPFDAFCRRMISEAAHDQIAESRLRHDGNRKTPKIVRMDTESLDSMPKPPPD